MRKDYAKKFQDLIPKLSEEEFDQLEQNIIQHGCTDSIKTWNGDIVDGHNRHDICTKHKISYKTSEIDLQDENHAKTWIINNQLGRRNISDFTKVELQLKKKEVLSLQGKENISASALSPNDKAHNTREILAGEIGVSTGKFGQAEVIIDEADEKTKDDLRAGNITIGEAYKDIKKGNKEKKEAKLFQSRKDLTKWTGVDEDLTHGDCIQEINKIEDGTIKCLLTDPPYGIDFTSGYREYDSKITKPIKGDESVDEAMKLLDKMLTEAYPKMNENSTAYIFTSWKVYSETKEVVSKHLEVKNLLIWVKNNWSMGDLYDNYAEQYEMVIFATKGKPRFSKEEKRGTNVLHYDRTTNKYHPTEKPIDLLEYLIKHSTIEGEIILDPFSGSGGTLIAAKQTKRKYIGIEKDEQHYNTAQFRLKEV